MKINLNLGLKNLKGEPMRDRVFKEDEEGQVVLDANGNPAFDRPPWTLKRLFEQCLVVPDMKFDERTGRDKPFTREEKIKMYRLAQNVHKCNGIVDLPIEDVALVKVLIDRKFPRSPLMVGRAFDAIENIPQPVKETKKPSGSPGDN